MSERLPYEEQLAQKLAGIPLPDEDQAWEDMRRRLEKDDDDRIIPFWLRGCASWGLMLLLLTLSGWWLLSRRNEQPMRSPASVSRHQQPAAHTPERDVVDKIFPGGDSVVALSTEPGPVKMDSGDAAARHRKVHPKVRASGAVDKEGQQTVKNGAYSTRLNKTSHSRLRAIPDKKDRGQVFDKDGPIAINRLKKSDDNVTADSIAENISSRNKTRASVFADTTGSSPESVVRASKDSSQGGVKQIEKGITNTDSAKAKTISFSAGLALYQLLPIEGQKLNPYNSVGRKASLGDYIPGVYFRMYKSEKWFLQAEFRYGAPQYNKELVYQQDNKLDTFGGTNTITSASLKKTFYHQLPVSFHYFLLPNWSIGAGFTWNTFKGAVSEQDVVQRTIVTGSDTVLSKGVILTSTKADSNFAKSYFQALMESQYKWRRFSLGARYSFGLQPYLKFRLPGQGLREESSRSLQVFIRYQLWKSKPRIIKSTR